MKFKSDFYIWTLSGGIGGSIIGILIIIIANETPFLFRILLAFFIAVISMIGMAWRYWYFTKDELNKERENNFEELLNSIKRTNSINDKQ
jgi:hypothetical protein